MNTTTLTIAGTTLGLIVGCTTMWWGMKDRMEKEILDRVKMEVRVTRLDERIKALESQLWTLQTNK